MSAAVRPQPPTRLLTAEEYAERPDPGYPEELVRGEVVSMPMPNLRHGQICNRVGRLLGNFAEDHDLGHVLNNDAGIITERDPDTVRGADVAFYSFDRLPRGPLPASYRPEMPNLVVEVVSPSDRWTRIHKKIAEYLEAGVTVVLVLDEPPPTVQVFRPDAPIRTLGPDDELTLPDLLPGFAAPVRRFFE